MKDNAKCIFNHFSSIFFRMSIFSMIILCTFFVSKLSIILIQLGGILLLFFSVIFTLGIIFLAPGGINYLHSIINFISSDNLSGLTSNINSYIPSVIILTGLLITLTIIGFSINYKKQSVRLGISILMAIVYIVLAILLTTIKAGA